MLFPEIEMAPEVMVPPITIIDPSSPTLFYPLIVMAESIKIVPFLKVLEERVISASLMFPSGIFLFSPTGLFQVFSVTVTEAAITAALRTEMDPP